MMITIMTIKLSRSKEATDQIISLVLIIINTTIASSMTTITALSVSKHGHHRNQHYPSSPP